MSNLGVVAGDSRDHLGQKRFFPFVPEAHLEGGYNSDDDELTVLVMVNRVGL